jgi:hypothetical protein
MVAAPPPSLSQTLTALDPTKQYTFTYFLNVYQFVNSRDCTLSVSLNGVNIYTRVYTPIDQAGALSYQAGTSGPLGPFANPQTLKIEYACNQLVRGTSSSTIFLDDVSFIAN